MKSEANPTDLTSPPQSIGLLHPIEGSIGVDPRTDIVIRISSPPDGWRDKLYITLNGYDVVEKGHTAEGVEPTQIVETEVYVEFGFRLTKALPPRDILVQARVGSTHMTRNSRFYIQGAETKPHLPGRCLELERIPGGFFGIRRDEWCIRGETVDIPDRFNYGYPVYARGVYIGVYPKNHAVLVYKNGNLEIHPTPPYVLGRAKSWDATYVEDLDEWMVLSKTPDELGVLRPESYKSWDLNPQSIDVSSSWVNLDFSDKTAHLPASYVASRAEGGLDSWYLLDNPGHGQSKFRDDLHVWWNSEQMLAKHDPVPFTNAFDGMLWESDDIDEAFKRVDLVDSHHVTVNDRLYLNTKQPKITHVS